MTIICLMGPTATGKTALAIQLVCDFPCEIISVDSGMIYRSMDIGTAKPTAEELNIAPHHLINIRDPKDAYSVAQFRKEAIAAIEQILHRKKIPLLVGGTMLYFKVLLQGISTLPDANPEIRAQIAEQAELYGWEFLHKKLQRIDYAAAERINSSDSQRIQRALEVYELTGKSISELCSENQPQPLSYNALKLALIPEDRDLLRQKIDYRFKNMLQLGFIEEVEKLYQRGDLNLDMPSMRAVGYRQIWNYLAGKTTYNDMCEQVINATNQLAKRQLTWLRRWENLNRFDCNDANLKNKVFKFLKNNYQMS